jgi:hypothetical protein
METCKKVTMESIIPRITRDKDEVFPRSVQVEYSKAVMPF